MYKRCVEESVCVHRLCRGLDSHEKREMMWSIHSFRMLKVEHDA